MCTLSTTRTFSSAQIENIHFFSLETTTMVVKKYLCAAPRQEAWDERIDSLLNALDGDRNKLEKVLRQTINGLKERQ